MTVGMSYLRSVCWYLAGTAKTESGIGLDEKLLPQLMKMGAAGNEAQMARLHVRHVAL